MILSLGCGGGGTSPTPPPAPPPAPPPPPPPPPAPVVASVHVSPPTSSVLAGTPVPLSAEARTAQGTAIPGKTFTWNSSAQAVATVSAAGVVSTLAPGATTISAMVDGQSGQASVEVVDPTVIPVFVRPFAAGVDYFTTNLHDHDIPQAFFDNGRKVSFWGEQYDVVGYEGHEGYDWRMPEATPILAAAAGTVTSLASPAFFCPLINAEVPANGNGIVIISHPLPGGVTVQTLYAHLSVKSVVVGQQVTEGQQIGLSGTVGCSLNPHLHFQVRRMTQTNNGQPSNIDPYGWSGAGSDPWLANAGGAASIRLWKVGTAPDLLSRDTRPVNLAGSTAFFGVTAVQAMGVRDDITPNNEYVEISRDPAFAPAALDIGGATVRTRAGVQYTIPAGTTLSAAVPTIRIYSGSGTGTATTFYMGKSAGIYDNVRECVQVFSAAGLLRNAIALGVAGCGP
ncbi:MAG: peptidoglycan DD-metalloendopeptidase family protein [Gemmatimonadales bacterium]